MLIVYVCCNSVSWCSVLKDAVTAHIHYHIHLIVDTWRGDPCLASKRREAGQGWDPR